MQNLKMKVILVLLLALSGCFGGQLKKRENMWYITGKGCGISTELKYTDKIPENVENLSCVIIQPKIIDQNQNENENQCSFMDVDFAGEGHEYFLDIESAFECRQICNYHEKCEVFVYVSQDLSNGARAKDCHMKWGAGVAPVPSGFQGLFSGYKYCKHP